MSTRQLSGARRQLSGARRQISHGHTVSFTDHAGRPAYSLWNGDSPDKPSFSFQVYTTVDLGNEALTTRWPTELFADDGGAWRVDVYEQLTDVWACVEHQKRERRWRKEQQEQSEGELPGRIVERYDDLSERGTSTADGFIVVIDRAQWFWRGSDDDGKVGGPLAVWFDTREQAEKRVVQGAIDEENMVFEQVELQIQRMPTATHPNLELKDVWMRAGMWEWEDIEELPRAPPTAEAEAEAQVAPAQLDILAGARVTTSETQSGSIVLQVGFPPSGRADDFTFVYTVYPAFATAAPLTADDRTKIGRSFLAHLTHFLPVSQPGTSPEEPFQTVRLEVAPQLPSLEHCLAHNASHAQSVGYLSSYAQSPQRRRFPEYGFGATTFQMRDNLSKHERFLVVLDREHWEQEDGVVFVWTEPRESEVNGGRISEVLVGRVGGGMRGVAERLAGIK